ncbi:CTB family bacteriocin [Nostocales cyanobacterium LEGE 11386]|nr:CTB family bacteriocin [Nostocales cyanobacterium LEGE 11386]
MSHQKITSDWFIELELSHKQQQLLVGGVKYKLSDNNFAQGMAATTKTNNSSPEGNSSDSNTQISDVNAGAKSFLSTDATELPLLSSLQ